MATETLNPDGKSRVRRHVLVVEDDDMVRGVIRDALSQESYDVSEASDGPAALDLAKRTPPDVMILDWGLPEMSGAEVCRELRSAGLDFPIVMLTARASKLDIVVGLELGADDYVTKPFDVRELTARVGAQVRRSERQKPGNSGPLLAGRVTIDQAQRRVFAEGEELQLTYTEFNLLSYMAGQPNTAISRRELLEKVWGYTGAVETKTVDAHVQRLRRKLLAAGDVEVTLDPVPGVGYRLDVRS